MNVSSMKKIPHFVSLLLLLNACRYTPDNDLSGCYRMIIKNDTATISINQTGDSVSGSLSYHWLERDNHNGTFNGAIRNDTLIVAHYTFQSEKGITVKQVVFKIKDTILLQGYGEEMTKNDTTAFRDIDLVIFDTKHPFIRSCE